jgi:23S rRNA (cytosine1962-C5)-methyltransferase
MEQAGEMGADAALLTTDGWEDYALLDTGDGRKLERFGAVVVDRPEPQALWAKRRPEIWARADAAFEAQEEAEQGAWTARAGRLPEWSMGWNGISLICRATSFRHVGVFPEQVAHWTWMDRRIRADRRPISVLNLFGYTGAASLVAAGAGAKVTHVDASKKSIAWARENQAASGLEDRPIRWICDDASKFVAREVRRGNVYDGIILDPPKYGRGPGNEVWRLFEDLPRFLGECALLLSAQPSFVILSAYAVRLSFLTLHELMTDAVGTRGGSIESGELVVRDEGGRRLSTSLHARWIPGETA